MRRSLLMSAVMAIVFAGAAVPSIVQTQSADSTQTLTVTTTSTVTGILVDGSCYTTRGKTAMGEGAHEKCAIVCGQKGHRLAVVTDKGDVYAVIGGLALNNNAKLIPFINKTVLVTGTIKTVVIQDYLADTVQTVLTKIDKRRPNGTEEGVVPPAKKGDARQGDVLTAAEVAIEATAIDLVKVP